MQLLIYLKNMGKIRLQWIKRG